MAGWVRGWWGYRTSKSRKGWQWGCGHSSIPPNSSYARVCKCDRLAHVCSTYDSGNRFAHPRLHHYDTNRRAPCGAVSGLLTQGSRGSHSARTLAQDPRGPLKTQYTPLKILLGPPDFGARDLWLSLSYHPMQCRMVPPGGSQSDAPSSRRRRRSARPAPPGSGSRAPDKFRTVQNDSVNGFALGRWELA